MMRASRPERRASAARSCLFCLVYLSVLQWTAVARDDGSQADRDVEVLDSFVISQEPESPEALFKRSYVTLPRQRLVHSLRQTGRAVHHLTSNLAICSSLTGPDCLYGPVSANPNDVSEQVPREWRMDETNFKVTFMVVKSDATTKSLQELLKKAVKKTKDETPGTESAEDGGSPTTGSSGELPKLVGGWEDAELFFPGDQASVPDLERVLNAVAESMGWGPEEAESLKPKLAKLLAATELIGAKLSKAAESETNEAAHGRRQDDDEIPGASKEARENLGPTATDGNDPSVGPEHGEGLAGVSKDQRVRSGKRYERVGQEQGQKPESAVSPNRDGASRQALRRKPKRGVARSNAAWSDPFGIGGAVASAALSLSGAGAEANPQEPAEALSTPGPSVESQACEEDGTCALEEGDILFDPPSDLSDELGGRSLVDGVLQERGEDKPRDGGDESIDLSPGKSSDGSAVDSEGVASSGRNSGHRGVWRSSGVADVEGAGGQQSGRSTPIGQRQGAVRRGDSSGIGQPSEASRGALGRPSDKGSAGASGKGQLGKLVAKSRGLHQRDGARGPGLGEQEPAFELVDQEEIFHHEDYDMDSELDNTPNEWLDHYAEYIFNITGGYDLGYYDYYDEDY